MSPNMICIFRKGKSYIKTETHRGKKMTICSWRLRLEFCYHELRNTWGHQKLEEAVKESSLEPTEGSSVEPMFLDFWSPKLRE